MTVRIIIDLPDNTGDVGDYHGAIGTIITTALRRRGDVRMYTPEELPEVVEWDPAARFGVGTLAAAVAAVIPNAEPIGPSTDTARFEWVGGVVMIDRDDDHPDRYRLGVYDAGDDHGDSPLVMVAVNGGIPGVAALVDELTDLQPEGTDWTAWAVHYLIDISDAVTVID